MATPIRQTPIICNGHTRPVVDLCFAEDPECGPLLISSSKGIVTFLHFSSLAGKRLLSCTLLF